MHQWDNIDDAFKSMGEDRINPPSSVKERLDESVRKEKKIRFFLFGGLTVLMFLLGTSAYLVLSTTDSSFIQEDTNQANTHSNPIQTEVKTSTKRQNTAIEQNKDSIGQLNVSKTIHHTDQQPYKKNTTAINLTFKKTTNPDKKKETNPLTSLAPEASNIVTTAEHVQFGKLRATQGTKPTENTTVSQQETKNEALDFKGLTQTSMNLNSTDDSDIFNMKDASTQDQNELEKEPSITPIIQASNRNDTFTKEHSNDSFTIEEASIETSMNKELADKNQEQDTTDLTQVTTSSKSDSTALDSIQFPLTQKPKTNVWTPFIGLGAGLSFNSLSNPKEASIFPEFGVYGGYTNRKFDFEAGLSYSQMQSNISAEQTVMTPVVNLVTQQAIDSLLLMYDYIFDTAQVIIDSVAIYEYDTTMITFYDTTLVQTNTVENVYFRSNVFSIPLSFHYYFNFGKFNLGVGAQIKPSFMTLINVSNPDAYSKVYQFQLQVAPIASLRYDISSKWSILAQGGYGFGLTSLYFDERLSTQTKWNAGFVKVKFRYYFNPN